MEPIKQMTKEEKLEKAKELYKTANADQRYVLESLFPELKESEDKKMANIIREALANVTSENTLGKYGLSHPDVSAWLEKQGEQKPVDIPKFRVGDKIKLSCEPKYPAREIVEIKDNAYYFDSLVYLPIEKQNEWELVEQKPADKIEPKFKIGDTVTVKPMSCHGKVFKGEPFKIVDIIEDNYVSDDGKTYSISLQDGWELVEQKPNDKVKPKFKVGDYIINSQGTLRHIINVDKGCYQTDGGWLSHNTYEKAFHLWTIQDAKDGDVLYLQKDGKEHIIIYKGVIKERFKTFVSAYCAYNGIVDTFCFVDVSRYVDIAYRGIMPATKEQRDTLMKAMTDAGYEWDSEKKELKKVEHNPAWSEEDLYKIEHALFGTYAVDGATRLLNKIKSLRPQNTWKPSEEQMKALKEQCTCKKSTVSGAVLYELFYDLKKLREE